MTHLADALLDRLELRIHRVGLGHRARRLDGLVDDRLHGHAAPARRIRAALRSARLLARLELRAVCVVPACALLLVVTELPAALLGALARGGLVTVALDVHDAALLLRAQEARALPLLKSPFSEHFALPVVLLLICRLLRSVVAAIVLGGVRVTGEIKHVIPRAAYPALRLLLLLLRLLRLLWLRRRRRLWRLALGARSVGLRTWRTRLELEPGRARGRGGGSAGGWARTRRGHARTACRLRRRRERDFVVFAQLVHAFDDDFALALVIVGREVNAPLLVGVEAEGGAGRADEAI